MSARIWLALTAAVLAFIIALAPRPTCACCPAGPSGKPVVNADQTVIVLWDAAAQTQHFIRQASFKSDADDFGFLVPTPASPELDESGNEAFPHLRKLTEPEKIQRRRSSGMGCGCGEESPSKSAVKSAGWAEVTVLQDKMVAGFHAVVLEAKSADDLTAWLKEHGYAFSPEVQAWAKPYVEAGWKITALRVAKDKGARDKQSVASAALRISFKTDRPLFPYREPDPQGPAAALGAKHRLLRIYFIGDARYQGELDKAAWTGRVAWSNPLSAADRKQVLTHLKLPESTGPAEWWLTEFEDDWPYRAAPADVYFARAADQSTVKREPLVEYVDAGFPTDVTVYALAAALVVPPLWRRLRRGKRFHE